MKKLTREQAEAVERLATLCSMMVKNEETPRMRAITREKIADLQDELGVEVTTSSDELREHAAVLRRVAQREDGHVV